ncbi:hypothetical protein [Bradyrhizobium ganzhouense]|uniref:hypothetical protein n=1 Tax=Bradyrhizobium ganzhouense TaxID=1179767 RepID=UPI003CEC9FFE
MASLAGCVTAQPVVLIEPAPPYPLLPVDASMSCEAMTASFMFSAKRAARLEFWLEVGRLPGYGTDMFGIDAPRELAAERRRLDALTDLQRTRGCPVMEPGPAVVYERQKLEGASKTPALRVRG